MNGNTNKARIARERKQQKIRDHYKAQRMKMLEQLEGGLSVREIAKLYELSSGYVKLQIDRARNERLQTKIKSRK